MPKAASGPKLRLFGPDTKHGARKRPGFTDYWWYVVWTEGRKERSQKTEARLDETGKAEGALEAFLKERNKPDEQCDNTPAGGFRPHEIKVTEVLRRYFEEEAPTKDSYDRIELALVALNPYWESRLLSEVGEPTCKSYVKWRTGQPTRNSLVAQAAWERRRDAALEKLKDFKQAPPVMKLVGQRTARTELEYLRAAIGYCRRMLYITEAVPVVLPEKGKARDVWVTRTEFARMLLAARERVPDRPNFRRHLIVYMLVGVYHGARKEAILSLPLVQPFDGGAWIDAKRGMIDFGDDNGNKKRARNVPIHPRLRTYVRKAFERGQKYLIEFFEPQYAKVEDHVLHAESVSRPVKNIRRAFASCVQRAGIQKRVTPHTLRHTSVSWLKQTGMKSDKVGQYVGMSEATVENVYGHHDPDHMLDVHRALTSDRRRL